MSEQKICPTCGTEYPLSERFCPRDGTALRSSNAQADLLGSIIADRYHILRKLGEGGMGTVYLAEHVKMGRKSALKVMNPGMNTDPDAIARFNREAANAARLSHPNICGIYDFGETSEGLIYLAMEFIEGSSLTSLIEKSGALPAPRCGSIIHQVADALQVAHDAGIVHRDLKPDNIMVAKARDGSDLVKVVDFGIAKASSSDAQKVTKTGLVVGTPEYMSPEQLAGDKLDGRSDIYSLGLVAFNCLTGKLPFPAETVQEAMIMRLTDRPRTLAETRPEMQWPTEVQRTLDHALQRDAAERYQSAAQFGREFAAAISAMPATQAMEAGTMVIGAGGGAAQAVPPTRQQRASGATRPMEAPAPKPAAPAAPAAARAPAVERRTSKTPVIAGTGLVLAGAIAAIVWLKPMGGPPVSPTVPPASGDTASPQSTQSTQSTPPAGADSGATTKGADVLLNRQTTQPPPQTQTNPPANNPAASPANPPSGDDAAPADPEVEELGTNNTTVMQRIVAMRDSLENETMSEAGARQVIRRMTNVRRNRRAQLSRLQLADTWYVEMLAQIQIDNDPGVCRAARQVLQLHPSPDRRGIATTAMDGRSCGGQ